MTSFLSLFLCFLVLLYEFFLSFTSLHYYSFFVMFFLLCFIPVILFSFLLLSFFFFLVIFNFLWLFFLFLSLCFFPILFFVFCFPHGRYTIRFVEKTIPLRGWGIECGDWWRMVQGNYQAGQNCLIGRLFSGWTLMLCVMSSLIFRVWTVVSMSERWEKIKMFIFNFNMLKREIGCSINNRDLLI